MAAYTLEHAGRKLSVEASRRGLLSTAVTAFADGEPLGQGVEDGLEPVRIPIDDEWHIETDSLIPGRLRRCELRRGDEAVVPFDPPAGTRAAKLARLRRDRPRLYAARHVVVAVAQVLAAVLGLSVLLGNLLPAIDIDIDIPWPDVDLPNLNPIPTLFGWVPGVLDFLFGWLPGVLDFLFGWLPDVDLPNLYPQYWVPVLIAIAVAAGEVRKRRRGDRERRRADEQARQRGD